MNTSSFVTNGQHVECIPGCAEYQSAAVRQAIVDMAELMQVDDVFTLGGVIPVAPIPDVDETTAEDHPRPMP